MNDHVPIIQPSNNQQHQTSNIYIGVNQSNKLREHAHSQDTATHLRIFIIQILLLFTKTTNKFYCPDASPLILA